MRTPRRLLGSAALTGLAIAGLAAFAPVASASGPSDGDLPELPPPWEWCEPAGTPGVPPVDGSDAQAAATDIVRDLVPCIPGEPPEQGEPAPLS